MHELAPALIVGADELSHRLGYPGPPPTVRGETLRAGAPAGRGL